MHKTGSAHATQTRRNHKEPEMNQGTRDARSASTGSDRGSRLPADWVMSADYRAYCATKRPELSPDAVAEDFRDYWVAQPGAKGRKSDWFATWRTWVRKQRAPFAGSARPMPAIPSGPDATRPAWATAAGFATRFDAENAGCFERNASQFRGGRRTAAGSTNTNPNPKEHA